MTSTSMLLVFSSMMAAGISDFLYKRAQHRGVQTMTFMMVQSVFFNLCAYVIIIYLGVEFSWKAALFGIAAGYTGFPGMLLLLRSLRYGDATINVPIYRLSFIITAAGAIILLSEPARPSKILAIALAAASILLLSNVGALRKSFRVGGMGSLLAGTLLFSITGLVHKAAMLSGVTPTSVMAVQAPVVMVSAIVLTLASGPVKLSGTAIRTAPWCGILLSTSMFLLLISLQWGEASINVPIVQLSFVVTAALALLLLREKLTLNKALGIAAATASVVVFML